MSIASNFIIKHDRKIHRALEIMPGVFSWSTIIFFFFGSFLIPFIIAYLVILFDIFWFYKSITFAITALLSYFRIKASEKMNWMGEVKGFPDWQKVQHVVIIPQYKEPIHIIERSVQALVNQTFPTKLINVVMATESRDSEGVNKAEILKKKYGNKFANFFITVHKLTPQETAGKHSNENWAARFVKNELVNKQKIKIDRLIVTSSDADHCFNPQHFAYLTFSFLDNPNRYLRFWQPAVFFYNNFWRLPAIVRTVNTFNTIWNGAILSRKDRLISCQNYSLSFKLLDEVDYWDPEIIPEDYHLFFKAYYKKHGEIEVEPLYIPLYADAAESTSFWGTIKNTYLQFQRWSWGVSDDPNVIKNYLLTPTVSFWDKTIRLLKLFEDHVLMPVNWFWITLGVIIPSFFVPEFSRTALGYLLPKISSLILTCSMVGLLTVLFVNTKLRPSRPANVSRLRAMLIPLEFVVMPIAGLFFGALPGLDAHTRLMLGKYLEYRLTEKV
jgi:cellulose synthase/poly-beta-1,6-N-acetylglucosamine synthase-like glycosyltransferase